MADEQRIAVLEQHVRKLYEQIGALREELRTRDGVAPAPAPVFVPEPPRFEEAPRVVASAEPAPPPPKPSREPNLTPAQTPDLDLE